MGHVLIDIKKSSTHGEKVALIRENSLLKKAVRLRKMCYIIVAYKNRVFLLQIHEEIYV